MSASQSSGDSRQMAGLAHLLGIITGFLAPLIIWLMKKDSDEFAAKHAKEALNFQITVVLLYVVNITLGTFLWFIWLAFGWLISLAIFVVTVWWAIMGYQAASKGAEYKYPVAIRPIS